MSRIYQAASLLALSAVIATSANAIVYTADRSVGTGGHVTLSITTDGTIGNITSSNITDYSIQISGTAGTYLLNPGDSQVAVTGGLAATAGQLTFDFASSNYALFQNPYAGSGQNFYCFAGSVCGTFDHAENLLVGSDYSQVETNARSGVQVVATAGGGTAAVPEPASWAMFIGGFGLVGSAMRRRQRTNVSFG